MPYMCVVIQYIGSRSFHILADSLLAMIHRVLCPVIMKHIGIILSPKMVCIDICNYKRFTDVFMCLIAIVNIILLLHLEHDKRYNISGGSRDLGPGD